MISVTGTELAERCTDVARNYKTLYVMGCFGAPMTASNKTRYCSNHSYNRNATRQAMIRAASSDTFGFDCVNLIKGILWGWNGNRNHSYGGASYASQGVPDVSADGMIKLCQGVSNTGWESMAIGEAVWMSGHIGVYIGNGLAVECTPKWANCVQITAVGNIGKKSGYNTRTWTKHGKIPYVSYVEVENLTKDETLALIRQEIAKIPAPQIPDAAGIARNVYADIIGTRQAAPASDWAKDSIATAMARGLTDGSRPQDYLSRQEAAVLALRILGIGGTPGDWSEEARKWAVETGLIIGTGTDEAWTEPVTREQIAQILFRLRSRLVTQ